MASGVKKRQKDQGGKHLTTSVIRWHWWSDHGLMK